mgnify:CR=1 FL=1
MVSKIEHKNRTGCPIACSLDILGDHWTLLVIRNLMFLDVHEYKDMLKTEEQISSSILSDRLQKLECEGVIASIPHPDSKRRKLYYLTPVGKDLIHLMMEIVLWANSHLSERLDIPAEKKKLLEKNPEKFKTLILDKIQKWEEEHLY